MSELRILIDRMEDAEMALNAAERRLAAQTDTDDAVTAAAAAMMAAAEEIMGHVEDRTRQANEQVAYWQDPIAAHERVAAE